MSEDLEQARYSGIVVEMIAAAAAMAALSEQVGRARTHQARVAERGRRLAEEMARLEVDGDTVAAYLTAAEVTAGGSRLAALLAAVAADMGRAFDGVQRIHQAEYGSVAAAAEAMTVPMANADFYRAR
jgi:hypothetical protein